MATKSEEKNEAMRIHPDSAWLSYDESMILSGWSKSTISRLVRSGQLQAGGVGKRGVKVKRAALMDLMERGGNPTGSDGS